MHNNVQIFISYWRFVSDAEVIGNFTCVSLTPKAGVCIVSTVYDFVFDDVLDMYVKSNDYTT